MRSSTSATTRSPLGRPHPMIDPTLRLELLAEQAADPDVAVLLLDVVLGHAADPDPAGGWRRPSGTRSPPRRPPAGSLSVVVALCGTAADPQDREAQAAALVAAGARVFASNAAAARAAGWPAGLGAAGPTRPPQRPAACRSRPGRPGAGAGRLGRRRRRTLGAAAPDRVQICWPDRHGDLRRDRPARRRAAGAGGDVVTVDYRPPVLDTADAAAVPAALQAVLADPRRPRRTRWRPSGCWRCGRQLVDVRPAGEALGLRPGEFCHAGPPIDFAGRPGRCAAR